MTPVSTNRFGRYHGRHDDSELPVPAWFGCSDDMRAFLSVPAYHDMGAERLRHLASTRPPSAVAMKPQPRKVAADPAYRLPEHAYRLEE